MSQFMLTRHKRHGSSNVAVSCAKLCMLNIILNDAQMYAEAATQQQ